MHLDPLTLGWFADPSGLVSPVGGISILETSHTYPAGLIGSLVDTARAG